MPPPPVAPRLACIFRFLPAVAVSLARNAALGVLVCGLLTVGPRLRAAPLASGEAHVWEMQEITFQSARAYPNAYADVELWIQLEGPGFSRKVHGFWDGGRTFKVRFVATAPGAWHWTSGSNQADDPGLNSGRGELHAVAWQEADLAENPNRRGFVRPSENGHALRYADGTPFFLVGDTWLAASTWRLPWKGIRPAADYVPGPGISFEEAVSYRKQQGFNSVSFISAFPNWAADHHGATFANSDGIFLRNAWEKFGQWAAHGNITTADGATTTAKDMADENGNTPFEVLEERDGMANFDRLNPAYFRSLDRKMKHLSAQGFVPFFETVRRDCCPSWKAYFDFNRSYARYFQYLIARYGSFNLVFSGIHLDWIPQEYSLTADEFNAALTYHLEHYGRPPFGQPVTALIDSSTLKRFGAGDRSPWLQMHTVGNKPRNNAIYASLEEIFRLDPSYPAANLEPYYTGWNHMMNRPGGETPAANSDRDNYFARSMMYGSVLSGGLAGHVHGTAAYDVTSTGEAEGWRPFIWDALLYRSGAQMQHLRRFVLSEGARYQDLQLATDRLVPRRAGGVADNGDEGAQPKAGADGLDGWSFLMLTADDAFGLLYFEHKAEVRQVKGLSPAQVYRWQWFDPRSGEWLPPVELTVDADGLLPIPAIPAGKAASGAARAASASLNEFVPDDWAGKMIRVR
jgi:hypothetical protein